MDGDAQWWCGAGVEVEIELGLIKGDIDDVTVAADPEAEPTKLRRQPRLEPDLVGFYPQASERAQDEVNGSWHGAEVDAFAGCAALGVVKVGNERLAENVPAARLINLGQDRGMRDPAQRGAVRGAGQRR